MSAIGDVDKSARDFGSLAPELMHYMVRATMNRRGKPPSPRDGVWSAHAAWQHMCEVSRRRVRMGGASL
jgi:hypothetical protein